MHRLSFRKKIMFTVLAVFLVFGVLASVAVFYFSRFNFLENSKKSLELVARDKANESSQVFYSAQNIVESISKQDDIKFYVENYKNYQNPDILKHLGYYNIGDNFSAIYLLNKDGITLASTDPTFTGKDYSFRDYFINAMAGNSYVDVSVGVTSGQLGYYFSSPVKSDNGDIIGVAIIKTKPEFIHNSINLTQLSPNANIMLTDEYGVVIFSNVNNRVYKSLGMLNLENQTKIIEKKRFGDHEIKPIQYDVVQDNISQIKDISLFEFWDQEDGKKELLAAAKIDDLPFYLIIEEDVNFYIFQALSVSLFITAVLLLVTVFSVLIIYFLLFLFFKPFSKLEQAIRNAKKNNFSQPLDIKTGDEMQSLAEAYNSMIKQIKISRRDIEKKVEEQTKNLKESRDKLEQQKDAMLNILEDAESEKKRSQELATDLEKFKLAVENASDHIVITDPDGAILYANKAVEKITGFEPEEIIGKKAGSKELWGGLMGLKFYKDLWNTIKIKKIIFQGEIKNKRKNGEVYSAIASVAPVLDDKKNILFFIGIERDITEQKLAEERITKALNDLRERSQTLAQEKVKAESLLANVGDGIIATDQDGKITTINKSAEDMLGWQKEEVVGKPVTQFINVLDDKDQPIPLSKRPMVLALATGKRVEVPRSETYYFVRRDKTKFAAGLTVTPFILHNKIIGTVEVFRDITLEKSIDQAKTEFVSLASHQLRTPLSAINWYSEVLLDGDAGKLNREQKDYVNMIYQGNQRMVDLVNSLLNVSRLELGTFTVEPENVDMVKIAESVLTELEIKIREKKLTVNKTYKPKSLKANVDPKLLRIVFQNLLSNAVKYNKDRGNLGLVMEKQKDKFLIRVSDTGMGIPRKDQSQIFQKLFRADNVKAADVEGTGLGLYIVKSIIEHSDGKVWFESSEGRGTTFYISLPLKGMTAKKGTKTLG